MTQEALKLALEALENHTAIKHPQQIHYRDKAITAIKEALAQPEPCDMGVICIGCSPRNADGSCPSSQRTWVGLMDDEIDQAIESINMLHGDYATEVAYAIEAKLKDKNS